MKRQFEITIQPFQKTGYFGYGPFGASDAPSVYVERFATYGDAEKWAGDQASTEFEGGVKTRSYQIREYDRVERRWLTTREAIERDDNPNQHGVFYPRYTEGEK